MDPGKRSLRDKIFSRLPKTARMETPPVAVEALAPSQLSTIDLEPNPEPDVESDGSSSVGDHLVNLEDIDLDSQFFSQAFSSQDIGERGRPEPEPEVLSSDSEQEEDVEDRGRICEMLSQLAQFNSNVREVAERREEMASVEVGIDSEDILRTINSVEGIESVEQKDGSGEEWETIKAKIFEEPKQKDVEITITQQKTGKNGKIIDVDACLRRLLQSERRDKFLHAHQVHLLCLLGRGFYLNMLVNEAISNSSQEIAQLLIFQQEEVPSEPDFEYLKSVCDICQKVRQVDEVSNNCRRMFSAKLTTDESFVLLSIAILRFLAIEARLVMYLNVISKNMVQERVKPKPKPRAKSNPPTELPTQRYTDVALTTAEILKRKPEFAHFSQVPQLDGADDEPVVRKRPRLWKLKLKEPTPARVSVSSGKAKRGTTSRFFSKTVKARQAKKPETDQKPALSLWIEVYLEKCWIPVDILSNQVGLEHVMKLLPDPTVYVFGWSKDGTLQDVSGRYWWKNEMAARHQRVTEKWLRPVVHRFDRRRKIMHDLVDQLQFRQLRTRAPIPEKLSEFKNHPSYCLKRDLLKFQAIYPPEAPPLGFFLGEPIYGRECVHTLHSREVWLRHAKTIRLHESAYKVVMSKLRRDPVQLELFGHWQTEEYVPPEPRDGKVPRNAYGNIEIFKECMLPQGAVHLKQSNISRICRRLNVDYAPAVVGFGVHAGGNHPVFEGVVICREYEQRVLDEYERDLVEQEQRKREKRQRRIYDNWRKLTKGLLIRSRLRAKYNFDRL